MAGQMYFRGWGVLDWLEPKDYIRANWRYIGTAEGEDGRLHDIVRLDLNGVDGIDVRYTIV